MPPPLLTNGVTGRQSPLTTNLSASSPKHPPIHPIVSTMCATRVRLVGHRLLRPAHAYKLDGRVSLDLTPLPLSLSPSSPRSPFRFILLPLQTMAASTYGYGWPADGAGGNPYYYPSPAAPPPYQARRHRRSLFLLNLPDQFLYTILLNAHPMAILAARKVSDMSL